MPTSHLDVMHIPCSVGARRDSGLDNLLAGVKVRASHAAGLQAARAVCGLAGLTRCVCAPWAESALHAPRFISQVKLEHYVSSMDGVGGLFCVMYTRRRVVRLPNM